MPDSGLSLADTGPLDLTLPRLSWSAAPELCIGHSPGDESCLAYYGTRPHLRRLGLSAEPNDNRQFLLPAIAQAIAECGGRILISGAADEAMADAVIEAQPESIADPFL